MIFLKTRVRNFCTLTLITIVLFSCAAPSRAGYNKTSKMPLGTGELSMNIFSKTPILFNPDLVPNGYNEKDGLVRLGNGRIILKKLELPEFERDVSIKLKIRLVSNGDRWDKSGSCFVIPKDSPINLLSIARGEHHYPAVDPEVLENFVGIVPSKDYKPVIELMRFMTPFGVGYYGKGSEAEVEKTKPVYIDKWEDSVTWEEDISDVYPLLAENPYIGIYIDTWTKEGYIVDADLIVYEAPFAVDALPVPRIEPLINTVYYLTQPIPDIFSRKPVSVPFTVPRGAKNIRLRYFVTGHGGHSGGDEFVPRENIIEIDGKEVHRFTPWRTDCACFRRFNPSAGVWLQTRTVSYIGENGRSEKQIEEPIASSDLSRSNWCPGSSVPPLDIPLNISAGNHTLTIKIPEAQPSYEDKYNHWLVSAYLVWQID